MITYISFKYVYSTENLLIVCTFVDELAHTEAIVFDST